MAPYLDEAFGNPSGMHAVSRLAKNALEEARERAAAVLGAERPLDIVFTGGGTESDNLAVIGGAMAAGGGVVTSATEHKAVLRSAEFIAKLGRRVEIVAVDGAGHVDPTAVVQAVTDDTALVSVMAANNETGVLQPIAEVADAVHDAAPHAVVHTDAVQAFIGEDVTVASTGADLISLASHKFGGPKGVGLLYVRNGVELEPILHGGGQELGRRSGTHNVAGVIGMIAAMEVAIADRPAFRQRVAAARDAFEAELQAAVPGFEINAPRNGRLVQHSHVRLPGIDVETLLVRLDQAGIAAAAGSACQSGAIEVSHVLAAMGMDQRRASECVRFTFGWTDDATTGSVAGAAVAAVVGEMR
jgi:cysteine desulfurase